MQKITPNLWFDHDAEDAAKFYTTVFKDAKILSVSHYTEAGYDAHHMPAGTAMVVEFELAGQRFMALNGGPAFRLNEAVSFVIDCMDQAEVDYFWGKLSADPQAEQCGWLKDKFGLSWQVVPRALSGLLSGPHADKV